MRTAASGGGSGDAGADGALESVRSELRGLGYLDDSVERYLLQDALRPAPPARALWQLGRKVGLLLGLPAAALGAVALAAAHGHLRTAPFDILPLFVHLALPAVLVSGLGFALLAGLIVLLLRLTHARRIEAVSFAVGTLAAILTVLLLLDGLRTALAGAFPGASLWSPAVLGSPLGWAAALVALAVPAVAWGVFKVVHGGLLTLAIRLTDRPPEIPHGTRGRLVLAVLAAGTVSLTALAALDAGRVASTVPTSLPVTSGAGSVLLIGVDGVLAHELDFLLAAGRLPALQGLLDDGAAVVPIVREPGPPASLWASAATGVEPSRHGIESFDAYLPLGLSRPLGGDGWLGRWWSLLAPTPLVAHRPVLAASRRAHAAWELAGRGGTPIVSVGWWGTFPVEPQAGAVVAHGAFQLLEDAGDAADPGDGPQGVVHPPELSRALRDRVDAARLPADLVAGLDVAFGPERAREIERKALRPDEAYRDVFRASVERFKPRVAALYLAGLDVAAGLAPPEALRGAVVGSLVRWQLARVDEEIATLVQEGVAGSEPRGIDTVLLAVDPGRRGGDGAREGRLFVWRRGAPCELASAERAVSVGAVAAATLRAAGLPQSRELPAPPAVCPWPDPPSVIDTFGPRRPAESTTRGDEYLEQLQSLGYL